MQEKVTTSPTDVKQNNQLEKNYQKYLEAIEQIEEESVRTFLLSHLNPGASTLEELFCAKEQPGFNEKKDAFHEITNQRFSILALFYRHAPYDLRDALTDILLNLPPEKTVFLLANENTKARHHGDTILKYAPLPSKERFIDFLLTRTAEEIKSVLATKPTLTYSAKYLDHIDLETLLNTDENTALKWLALLKRLPEKERMSVLRTGALQEEYLSVLRLLAKPVSNEMALGLLNLLDDVSPVHIQKIFEGLHTRFQVSGETILHPITQFYSSSVAEKALHLLKKTDDNLIKQYLVSHRTIHFNSFEKKPFKDCPSIPLHMAFARTDDLNIGLAYLSFLEANPMLLTLAVEEFSGKSPIQIACIYNHSPAVTWYLEHLSLSHSFKTQKEPTPENLARTHNHPNLVSLFNAHPIYLAIVEDQSPKQLKKVLPNSLKGRKFLNTRWLERKTLLHLAAINGNVYAINRLLSLNAKSDMQDENGFTPLAYAMQHKHTKAIRAFLKHADRDIHRSIPEGNYPIVEFVKNREEAFIKDTLKAYHTTSLSMYFSQALQETLPFASLNTRMDNMEFRLTQNTSNEPLSALIYEQSKASKSDSNLSILYEISHQLQTTSNTSLKRAVQAYVLRLLKSLEGANGADKREKEATFLILSLCLSPNKLVELLKPLKLTDALRKILEERIIHTLLKPYVLARITNTDYQDFLSLIKTRSSQKLLFINLAKKASLVELPFEMVQDFSLMLTLQELEEVSLSTPHFLLDLLVLENKCKADSSYVLTAEETQRFHKALQNGSNVKSLAWFLTLLKAPALKKVATTYIDNHSELKEKTLALCFEPIKEVPFIPNSLMEDYKKACMESLIEKAPPKKPDLLIASWSQNVTEHDVSQMLIHYTISSYPKRRNEAYLAASGKRAERLFKAEAEKYQKDRASLAKNLNALTHELSSLAKNVSKEKTLSALIDSLAGQMQTMSQALLENTPLEIEKWQDILNKACETTKNLISQIETSPVNPSTKDLLLEWFQKDFQKKALGNLENTLAKLGNAPFLPVLSKERILKESDETQEFLRASYPHVLQNVAQHKDHEKLMPSFIEFQKSLGQKGYEALNNELINHPENTLINSLYSLAKNLEASLNPLQRALPFLEKLLDQKDLTGMEHLLYWEERNAQSLFAIIHSPSFEDLHRLLLALKKEQYQTLSKPEKEELKVYIHMRLQEVYKSMQSQVSTLLLITSKAKENTPQSQIDILQKFPIHLSPSVIACIIDNLETLFRETPTSLLVKDALTLLLQMMKELNPAKQAQVLEELKPECLTLLIEHALSGCHSENIQQEKTAQSLLRLCCHLKTLSSERLDCIKSLINKEDLDLLGNPALMQIAKTVLETRDIKNPTLDGVWCQRLLTSVDFIAEAKPSEINRLIRRYRFISLTLKQDEYQKLGDYLSKSKDSVHLAGKRQRLQSFKAEEGIRELVAELKTNCEERMQTHPVLANRALSNLNAYLHEQLGEMKTDKASRFFHHLFTKIRGNKGDLAKYGDTFFSWANTYIPHYNAAQEDLLKKLETRQLYNQQGKLTGVLDEQHWVWSYEKPDTMLIESEKEGLVLFDANQQRIGALNRESKLKLDNYFVGNTSALLVANVPSAELEKTPQSLHLLLSDIAEEKALDVLYEACSPAHKVWVSKQVIAYLKEDAKVWTKGFCQQLIAEQSMDELFQLLDDCENIKNAQLLYETILMQEDKASALFAFKNQKKLEVFFNKIDACKMFSNFLSHHLDKPYFVEGVKQFARFARNKPQTDLLVLALDNVKAQAFNKKITLDYFNRLLKSFMTEDALCDLLLDFLNDNLKTSIQEQTLNHSSKLASFFYKEHITDALFQLNLESSWQKNPKYRSLLWLFNTNLVQVIPDTEFRYAASDAWQDKELKALQTFLRRHTEALKSPDKGKQIAENLSKALLSRCANFGETDYFYQEDGQLNTHLLLSTLQKPHPILATSQNAVKQFTSKVKQWFNKEEKNRSEQLAYLKQHQAIVNWKALEEDVFLKMPQASLSYLTVFLLHYNGPVNPIKKLLKETLEQPDFLKNPDVLHELCAILTHYPHQDIGHCIYETLKAFLIQHPKKMNAALFTGMSQWYSHQKSKSNLLTTQACAMEWLKHTGLQKEYTLLQTGLVLLKKMDKTSSKLVRKAMLESKIEHSLLQHKGSWYFDILASCKRLWHYGWHYEASGLVGFCDENPKVPTTQSSPQMLKASMPCGKLISKELRESEKRKALGNRKDALMADKSQDKSAQSVHRDSFFKRNTMVEEPILEEIPLTLSL